MVTAIAPALGDVRNPLAPEGRSMPVTGLYIKIYHDFPDNPKIARLKLAERYVFIELIIYSARAMTDGLVPGNIARNVAGQAKFYDGLNGDDILANLIKAKLLEPIGDGDYQIHDYLDYQESRETIEVKRLRNNTRQTLFRDRTLQDQIRERDNDHCRYCGHPIDFNVRRGMYSGTYDHVDPDKGNTIENLVVACRSCNAKKGARTPKEARMPLLKPGQKVTSDTRKSNATVTSYGNGTVTSDSQDIEHRTQNTEIELGSSSFFTTTSKEPTPVDVGEKNKPIQPKLTQEQRVSVCEYETQIGDDTLRHQGGKLHKLDAELSESWLRLSLRQAFASAGPLPKQDVVDRFKKLMNSIEVSYAAIKDGRLKLRTLPARYVAKVAFNCMINYEP
jgi:5-methylcytosine-specific restriction endonuclease McrA